MEVVYVEEKAIEEERKEVEGWKDWEQEGVCGNWTRLERSRMGRSFEGSVLAEGEEAMTGNSI